MDTAEPISGTTFSEVASKLTEQEYSGGHRKAKVLVDQNFPHIDDFKIPAVDSKDFAYIVSYLESNSAMHHTPSMGRAGFYPITFEAEGKVYNCLFVKGTGKSKVSISEWTTLAPFEIPSDQKKDLGKEQGYEPPLIGINTREDQIRDAEMSIKLRDLGIKSRLPLTGFFLEEIEMENGVVKVEQLVKDGIIAEDERPYLSYWAMETPYRVSDLYSMISNNRKETEIRDFLVNATRYTQNLKDRTTNYFGLNLRSLIQEEAPTEKLLEQWTEFILNQVEPQFEKMAAAGLVHNNMHAQNISLHGEICDNGDMTSVSNPETAKVYFGAGVNVFFDGFLGIWRNFEDIKQVSPEYRKHFEERVFAIIDKFTN
jgi:hypothetical protein